MVKNKATPVPPMRARIEKNNLFLTMLNQWVKVEKEASDFSILAFMLLSSWAYWCASFKALIFARSYWLQKRKQPW